MALDTYFFKSTSVLFQQVLVSLKRKFLSRISYNISTIRVFQPLFIAIFCMHRFVSRRNHMFLLSLVFACLMRGVINVLPSGKFISSKHSSSKASTFKEKLSSLLDVWYNFSILYHQSYDPNCILLNVSN